MQRRIITLLFKYLVTKYFRNRVKNYHIDYLFWWFMIVRWILIFKNFVVTREPRILMYNELEISQRMFADLAKPRNASFLQSTKIGTLENRWIHSILKKTPILYKFVEPDKFDNLVGLNNLQHNFEAIIRYTGHEFVFEIYNVALTDTKPNLKHCYSVATESSRSYRLESKK